MSLCHFFIVVVVLCVAKRQSIITSTLLVPRICTAPSWAAKREHQHEVIIVLGSGLLRLSVRCRRWRFCLRCFFHLSLYCCVFGVRKSCARIKQANYQNCLNASAIEENEKNCKWNRRDIVQKLTIFQWKRITNAIILHSVCVQFHLNLQILN